MRTLEERARGLVAFDTTSDRSNVEAAEWLADELASIGCRVALQRWERDGVPKANLVATLGPARPHGLVVSGHLDTVPWSGQPGWTREPLRLEIEDDRVYGRGSSDMKVFLAQAVEAAGTVGPLERPLVLVFTADEELGYLGARKLVPELTRLLGDVPLPEFGWIGEPTGFDVWHAHKSAVLFTVTARGISGHSGRPSLGANAIAILARAIDAIGRYQEELRARPSAELAAVFPDAPYTTINFGTVRGGTAANLIAEEASVLVFYRSLPGVDPLADWREIRRRLEELEPVDYDSPRRGAIEVGEALAAPPFWTPLGTELEAALFEATGTSRATGSPLGTDGCMLEQAGLRSLVCGPGDFAQAHQPNESLSRAAFEGGTETIRRVVRRFCAAG